MLQLRKFWLRFFLWSALTLVLVFLMIVLPVFWKRYKAGRLLNEVRVERWSSVNFKKAKEISERYGGHPGVFGRQGVPCNANGCRFDIVISNSPMNHLHLAPETAFSVSIHVQNDHVITVSSDLLSIILVGSPPQPAPLGAHVGEQIAHTVPSEPGFVWTHSANSVTGASTVNVALNASATAAQRREAYDFNLGCLTKFGGCKEPFDFLPRASGWPR